MRVLTPDRFRTITRHLAHQCIGGYRAKHAVNTPLKMQRNALGAKATPAKGRTFTAYVNAPRKACKPTSSTFLIAFFSGIHLRLRTPASG